MANQSNSLDIGRVMSATFSVIGRHPLVFLGLSFVIAGLPYGLFQYVTLSPDIIAGAISEDMIDAFAEGDGWLTVIFYTSVATLFYALLTTLLQAMLIVATIRDLRNKEVDITHCLTEVLNRFLSLVGLMLLSFLGIILGLLLFIIPGIIVFLMWIVAVPVMMTERLGIVESLTRSAKLTSEAKGMIILLVFIYFVGSTMVGGLTETLGIFSTYASVVATIVVQSGVAAISAAGVAALYIELRTMKEGPLDEGLADVFA